jgi:hypothetical protein
MYKEAPERQGGSRGGLTLERPKTLPKTDTKGGGGSNDPPKKSDGGGGGDGDDGGDGDNNDKDRNDGGKPKVTLNEQFAMKG